MRRAAKSFLRGLGPALVLAVLASCQNLPELASGTCGNGVLDNGEDCDDISGNASATSVCGAPNTAVACRFTCGAAQADAGAASVTCPDGYRCGTDGICRQPSGSFEPTASVAVSADRMMAADLGGAGAASILAVSRDVLDLGTPRMLAFGKDGMPAGDNVLEGSFGLGGVGDADGDGHDDVLFSRLDGLLLTLGTTATTVTAVASDAIALPDNAHVKLATLDGTATDSERTAEFLTLVSNLPSPRDATHSYLFGTDIQGQPLAEFAWDVDDFTTRTAALPDPLFQCERLVVARRSVTGAESKTIESVQPCCPLEAAPATDPACGKGERLRSTGSALRDVLAETNHPIERGPWTVDIDGDARMDVVVLTRGETSMLLEVAYGGTTRPNAIAGDPSRALAAQPPALGTDELRRSSVLEQDDLKVDDAKEADAGSGALRTSALLDIGAETRILEEIDPATNQSVQVERRFLTLVDESFLTHAEYRADAPPSRLSFGPRFVRLTPWTSAGLASFRGDGTLDVVGGRTRALDLDVALGTEQLAFNISSIQTGLSTEQIAIADLDGDRTVDALITSNTGPNTQLSVLLGRQVGVPNELVALGTFARIRQMVAAPLAFGLLGLDSAADIGLVTTASGNNVPGMPPARGTDSVTILRSVGGRLPFSLYSLDSDSTASTPRFFASPLASAIVSQPGVTHVVALGLDSTDESYTRLWWGAATDDGNRVRLAQPRHGEPLAINPGLLSREGVDVGINAFLRPVDLDGDGISEVVGLSTDASQTAPALFVARFANDTYSTALAPTVIPTDDAPSTGGKYFRVFSFEPVDVDGDGYLDVVALLASAPNINATDETDIYDPGSRDTLVVVIPNEAGQLTPSRAAALTTPAKVRALAVGRIGTRSAPSAVIVTESGSGPAAQRSAYSLEDGAFREIYTSVAGGNQPLAGARSLIVADVTGDGIDDLVVGTRDRVNVLRADVVLP